MAKVEIKAPIVDEIKEIVAKASAAYLVDYRGLTVAEDTALRKELREAGVTYKVFKNTYLKRAFEGTDFAQLDKDLEGPTAIAFAFEDATAPARIIAKHAEKVEALSKIPAKSELISRLLGSMQSPIANLARVLKQIAEKNGNEAA